MTPSTPRERSARETAESAHFDHLAEELGETWWGNLTPSGIERLRRRGRLFAEAIRAYDEPWVLEIGCGTGAFSQHVLRELPDLHFEGVDISPKVVEIAAQRLSGHPHARFTAGSAAALDYADGAFDVVLGCSILHHLPMPDCLAGLYRVLKPGGRILFSEPNMANPQILLEKNVPVIGRWLQNTEEETAFFRRPLARALREAGFAEVRVRPFDFLHPALPEVLTRPASVLGRLLEAAPVVREFGGSLFISGRR